MAKYSQVTAPTSQPVDVEELRRWTRTFDEYEDETLKDLIEAATAYTEKYADLHLITQTWKLQLDGFPCSYNFGHPLWPLASQSPVLLEKKPVQSISSITYTDADGNNQTLSSSLYELDAASTPARVKPTAGNSWPSTKTETYNTVTVTFVTGYGSTKGSVPANIREAIMLLASHNNEYREGEAPIPAAYFSKLSLDRVDSFG